jgi:hypothetical protein
MGNFRYVVVSSDVAVKVLSPQVMRVDIGIGDNGPTFGSHLVSKACADDVRYRIWGQTHAVHALRLASLSLFHSELAD